MTILRSGLRDLAPERLAALRHVATIKSIGSSTTIEGARLSDQQVETLLQGIDTNAFGSRDEDVVAEYAEAMLARGVTFVEACCSTG